MNFLFKLAAIVSLLTSQGALATGNGLTPQRPADFHIQLPNYRAAYETPSPQGDEVQTEQDKPRVVYAQVFQQPQYQPGTIAALIERFIREMDGTPENPGVRPLGDSHRSTLERIQDESISIIVAKDLGKRDVITYCRWRREVVGVGAATVGHDMTCLVGVLKYAGAAWDDCDSVSDKAIKKAKPFLTKHGIVGKSTPRTQRPTDDQKRMLEEHFAKQNYHPNTITDMVKISRWQRASTRRIGESCALLWVDWHFVEQTILVRKMKDPKRRNKQKVVALPWDAQAMLEELAWEMNEKPELRDDEPRIFPFNSKTCSQRYTKAKKKLLIENLHLHDDRRDRSSKLIELDGYSKEEAIAFTGHETTQVFEGTYMEIDPRLMRFGPVAKRIQDAMAKNKDERLSAMTPRQAKDVEQSWDSA